MVASTPTPAPAIQPNPTFFNLAANQTFATTSAGLESTVQKGTGTPGNTSAHAVQRGTVSVRYDAAAQSYTLTSGTESETFAAANKDAGGSTTTITAYSQTSGTRRDSFAYFNTGSANPVLTLTYLSYGAWQRTTDQGNSLRLVQDFFVFGTPTAAADMPRTGTATYFAAIDGFLIDGTGSRSIGGRGQFSADFGNSAVRLQFTASGTDILTGVTRSIDSFDGTAPISGSSFSGPIRTSATGYQGTFAGDFYGPAAAEAGAAFNLTNGAAVISGVAVGKKN